MFGDTHTPPHSSSTVRGAAPLAAYEPAPGGGLGFGGLVLLSLLVYAIAFVMPIARILVPLLVGGAVVGVALRRWNDRHPSDLSSDDPNERFWRPEIDISRVRIGGDGAGLVAVIGIMVPLIIDTLWFRVSALCAVLFAIWLHGWRARHRTELTSILHAPRPGS